MKRILFLILFCPVISVKVFAQMEALIKIAESGDVGAQLYLGDVYSKYEGAEGGVKKDIQESYKWYLMAAKQNNAKAQFRVFEIGQELIDKNDTTALNESIAWLKKAAENGYPRAQSIYARNLQYQNRCEEAMQMLYQAVQYDPLAAFYLGWNFFYGACVEQDISKAKHFLEVAKENQMSNSHCLLGEIAIMENDYETALEYIQKAISLGEFKAYSDLAYLYAEGKGVKKDMPKAFESIDQAIAHAASTPFLLTYFLTLKGNLYLMESQIEEASDIWNQIKRIDAEYAKNSDSEFCKIMRSLIEQSVDTDIALTNIVNQHTYALIIANENYKHEVKVPYASNDGSIFKEYCHKTLGLPKEHIKLIADASYNDIRFGMNWLKQITATDKQAKVIFYYAGHGIPDEAQKDAYLLPIDGYASDVVTGYSLNELYKNLETLSTLATTVFLDACFSGAKREGGMLASARGVAIKINPSTPKGNMVVFTAAQGDETAYPYEKQKHGLFTYFLLKKLQETKGDVTLGELSDFVKTQVERQSVVVNGKLQTPTVIPSATAAGNWREMKLK